MPLVRAQSTFTETYFNANYPKPTGEVLASIKTPERLIVSVTTPLGANRYPGACLMAVDTAGNQIWNSAHWSFPNTQSLRFKELFLGSDQGLYVLAETSSNNVYQNFLLKINSLTGAEIWRKPFSADHILRWMIERKPGELVVVYTDKAAGYTQNLRCYDQQTGAVLRDVYLSDDLINGIYADKQGDLIYVIYNRLYKINGNDPGQLIWQRELNITGNLLSARFIPIPTTTDSLFYWFSWGTNSLIGLIRTGDGKILESTPVNLPNLPGETIIRGDTAFFCSKAAQAIYYHYFFVSAIQLSTATIAYKQSYAVKKIGAAPAQYTTDYSTSFDIDQDGFMYLTGYSSNSPYQSIGVIKARSSDGGEVWNKVADVTLPDEDTRSNGHIAWLSRSGKLWVGATLEIQSNVRTPALLEIDKTTGKILQQKWLSGNYRFASGLIQFLPVPGGYCTLKQLDKCIAVERYDHQQNRLWSREICRLHLLAAGGLYEGKDSTLYVTGTTYQTKLFSSETNVFNADSVHLFRLNLSDGQEHTRWRFPGLQGYPLHVAGLSDTIRVFVQNNGERRVYRILSNGLISSSFYQLSSEPAPLPLLRKTYVQRSRETFALVSPTRCMRWTPTGETQYDFPVTNVQVGSIAAIPNSRDLIAGGPNSVFRFAVGSNNVVWKTTVNTGLVDRVVLANDRMFFTLGASGNQINIKKFNTLTGSLRWDRFETVNSGKVTINDARFDTTTNRLMLCGSVEENKQHTIWLLELDTLGSVKAHSRIDGNISGPANRALSLHSLPTGQFLVGGQIQRSALDTAGFIWAMPSAFFGMRGQVFCDKNNNGQKDSTESVWRQTVTALPGNYYSFPNENGLYQISVFSRNPYTATVQTPSPHYDVVPANFSTAGFSTGYQTANIRLVPKYTTYDAAVSMSAIRPVRFGGSNSMLIDLHNLGTAAADSFSLELDCGPDYRLTDLTPLNPARLLGPLVFDNGRLSARLAGAGALDQFYFAAEGTLNTFLLPGDTIFCKAQLSPFPTGDAYPDNNSFTLALPVNSPFDPNDIRANPEGGVGPRALAPDGSLDVQYRVRFENTGNANTTFIRVETTIDPTLDPATFRLGATSAPCQVRFLPSNRIEFYFPDYILPPKALDSLQSNGYLFFKMKTSPGLSTSDTIACQAAIYFDYNPPVITNTAQTWIDKNTGTGEPAATSFTLYPNPAKAGTPIRFEPPLRAPWRLYRMDGRLVREGATQEVLIAPAAGGYQFVSGEGRSLLIVLE